MTITKDSHKCPICSHTFGSRFVLEAHVPDCSVSDALEQIAKQDIPGSQKLAVIANLGNLARAFTFAHEFDDATEKQRRTMYVCTECYTSEVNLMPAPQCAACHRSGTMMLASEFVDSLLDGDEAPSHLLN